jgi:hypothetical protein
LSLPRDAVFGTGPLFTNRRARSRNECRGRRPFRSPALRLAPAPLPTPHPARNARAPELGQPFIASAHARFRFDTDVEYVRSESWVLRGGHSDEDSSMIDESALGPMLFDTSDDMV